MARKESEKRVEDLSPAEIWARAEKRLAGMTVDELVDTFKNAGILTPSGRVAKPYRQVLVRKAAR